MAKGKSPGIPQSIGEIGMGGVGEMRRLAGMRSLFELSQSLLLFNRVTLDLGSRRTRHGRRGWFLFPTF
jgi:hypothetical protein